MRVAEQGMKAKDHPLAKSGWGWGWLGSASCLPSKPQHSCWWDHWHGLAGCEELGRAVMGSQAAAGSPQGFSHSAALS